MARSVAHLVRLRRRCVYELRFRRSQLCRRRNGAVQDRVRIRSGRCGGVFRLSVLLPVFFPGAATLDARGGNYLSFERNIHAICAWPGSELAAVELGACPARAGRTADRVGSQTPRRGIRSGRANGKSRNGLARANGRGLSMATALLILGILCLLAACHPYIHYRWSLIVLQPLRPAKRSCSESIPDAQLNCAICVSAYNEERAIARKVENLLALRAREPGLEILVYVDGASDRTAEILREYESQIDLYVATERHGKTYGMNLLAAKARAPILIFTDANVIMDMECVRDFRRYFRDPGIGCVCGNLVYTNDSASATASSGSAYWRFEEAIKKSGMEKGSMKGADGMGVAIRRLPDQPPPGNIL